MAQFLRARRSLVQPSDVGLPAGGRRRVAGLRREEVAVLAGISTDYYLRLEQGREDHPSDQVLDAVARALQLDDDAVTYMRNLMRHQSTEGRVERLQELHPTLGHRHTADHLRNRADRRSRRTRRPARGDWRCSPPITTLATMTLPIASM